MNTVDKYSTQQIKAFLLRTKPQPGMAQSFEIRLMRQEAISILLEREGKSHRTKR